MEGLNGSPLLRVTGLTKRFGGVDALKGVSFSLNPGQIVGLVGPNGSGKTTALNIVAGALRKDRGRVLLRDREISRLPAYKVARLGVVRTFQIARLFPELTVLDNLTVGADTAGQVRTKSAGPERLVKLLEAVGLEDRAFSLAGTLSYGQQKLIEVLRGAAVGASTLLLDEPFAGVNPTMIHRLVSVIRFLQSEQGVSFIIVDHEVRTILSLCDYIYVLNEGRNLTDGDAEHVRSHPETIQLYLGRRYGRE